MVLHFMFMPVIHFELISVRSVKSLSRFIVLHVASSCSNTFRYLCSFALPLLFCQRSVDLCWSIYMGLFLASILLH